MPTAAGPWVTLPLMIGILLRIVINALALWLAATLVPGIHASDGASLIWAAVLLGVVNAVIRPLVVILTLPVTVISLGGFLLVVNAGMLALVALLLDGFAVDGFFAAVLGGIVISVTSWLASAFIGPRGRYEVLVVQRRR
ncbi:MAG: phage holin family protein [Pseudomonadales bacterium]